LTIEQESLRLVERDLSRISGLRTSNAVTAATYDETLRGVLTQRQSVQSLKSQLNVLPAQRQALSANLVAKNASLGQAQLDRDRTELRAPFDCRLGDVALEVGQFVTTGQVLFDAYGAALTEVEAQVPIDQVRRLLASRDEAVDLSVGAMQTIRAIFDVEAIVRMRTGDFSVEWQGRFDRIREELDLQTRTLRIVIAVDKPYESVVPGKRPPLSPGMFCEVELRGAERPDQIVVPRSSVRDGAVFILDDETRLVRQPVKVAFSQGAISVISEGLQPGQRLVVSEAAPAVEGMLVAPTLDEAIARQLVAQAAGEGDVR
jgi:RND family efflux transporter MFP subunit